MNKRQSRAFIHVRRFLDDEGDRRAGAFTPSHPYMRELRRAQAGAEFLRTEIERLTAQLAKRKDER